MLKCHGAYSDSPIINPNSLKMKVTEPQGRTSSSTWTMGNKRDGSLSENVLMWFMEQLLANSTFFAVWLHLSNNFKAITTVCTVNMLSQTCSSHG